MRAVPVLVIVLLGLVLIAVSSGFSNCVFTSNQKSDGSQLSAWVSSTWVQTNKSDFDAGVPVNVDTATSPGTVTLSLASPPSPAIYALLGNTTTGFYRYNVTENTWTAMRATPAAVGAGGALSYTGGDYIYALRGGTTTDFWRYSISGNTWTAMTGPANPVGAGGALSWAGGDYIYAFRGASTNNFSRYSISGDSWTLRTAPGNTVSAGGALSYTGGDFIYAFRGTSITDWRYNITANSWATRTNAPAGVGPGGALTYVGGSYSNFVYGFRGNVTATFWRHSISANSWTAMTAAPNTVNAGGALTNDGSTYLYAFRGGNFSSFWRYNISGNSWNDTLVADPTSGVGWGGSLVYVPAGPTPYASPGSLASQVLDTTTAATRWDVLDWNKTLPAGTALTFEVRASDTPFVKTNSTLSWISVGGTSPVFSGLPAGRYKQWRANLSTSDPAKTPYLSDATIYYTDPP